MHKVIQTIKSNLLLKNYIKYFRNLRVVGTLASAGLITVMTLTVHPIINKTQSAEAAIGASVQSETTLTMTSGYSSAELNLTPNANGVFSYSSDDELAKFGITTNNYTGYTLSIAGSDSNSNKLTNNATGEVLDSIETTLTSNLFDNNAYNGKWGYFPSKYNSEENLVFRPAPTTTASTLDVTSSANTADTNEYTIGLGARADMSTPAGTYTNTFILTAVGNPVGYTITYADNSEDSTVTNLPDPTTGSTSTTNITLTSSTPTRDKYAFEYWCLGEVTDNGTVCNGATYLSGATYDIDQTNTNIATLYAVWKLNAYDITIKTNTGISKVTLNGTECTSTSGCVVTGLISGQSYTLTAATETGYTFTSWNAGSNGSIADTSSTGASTTYTVGAGESTITPSATINSYTITLSRSNADAIMIDGTSRTGSSISLTYGSHTISGTYPSGYEFSSWATSNSTNLAIANTSSASTSITVHGAATLTLNGKSSCTSSISGNMQSAGTNASYCADATGSMTDTRDNQVYTIAKLGDGKLWMTRNLAIGCAGSGSTYSATRKNASLTSANSNVSSNYTISTSAVPNLTSDKSGSYTKAYMQCSDTYGAWYNYMAATAGTISGSNNTTNATYDICPSGWRLPTKAEQSAIIYYRSAYSPAIGGGYSNGGPNTPSSGFWWSSTEYGSILRYYLRWTESSYSLDIGSTYRYYGYCVRCVRSS